MAEESKTKWDFVALHELPDTTYCRALRSGKDSARCEIDNYRLIMHIPQGNGIHLFLDDAREAEQFANHDIGPNGEIIIEHTIVVYPEEGYRLSWLLSYGNINEEIPTPRLFLLVEKVNNGS